MFTGLIKDIGTIKEIKEKLDLAKLELLIGPKIV